MSQTRRLIRSCGCSKNSGSYHLSTRFLAVSLLLLIGYTTAVAPAATAQSRFFYAADGPQNVKRLQRQASDVAAALAGDVDAAEASSCCQGAAAEAAKPVTVSLELGNVTNADFGESTGSSEGSFKENFKRSVSPVTIRNAPPASCSPQPTIVDLTPLADQQNSEQQIVGNFYYSPACTRVNRCSGCCGSTLISCQPTQTEVLQLRVRKVDRSGATGKRGFAILPVVQHLACRCDCRIKAEDCNTYQEYRKDLCRCECHNTNSRDKCLEQSENKYWDDANCTCACRYNQSCTTGTVFDETQCKCTDPSKPIDIADRRRFIVQAVAVEPDNTTLYTV